MSEITTLKGRVKELENLVSSLKKRLEELRKAKSTTVLKKEKEYISTANPKHQKSRSSKPDATLEQKLEQLKIQHEKEIRKLMERKPVEVKCNHLEEISKLKAQNESLERKTEELEHKNEDLKEENNSLLHKFEELFTELSIKEAHWCEKEEQLNLKLKLQWGEKYREWMAVTEAKISELQAANDLLRRYVKPPEDD
ncbi:uncharacterized protein [Antedon mediterranea]|uniref:uncharacterized protein n=1 Tax=Antedon mediterranea TaxID=105859 RepID=UPI003AF84323